MVYLDDSILQAGKIASAGSKMLRNFAAPFDAEVVTRLNEPCERAVLGEFGLEPPKSLPDGVLLCNDVFGHVRTVVAERGLCSLRPTYGTVSRYGLIPTACSMDQIGVVCRTPAEGFSLLARIAGHDEKDGAMFPDARYSYEKPAQAPRLHREALPYADLVEPVFHILAYAEISGNLSRYDGVKFGYRAENYKTLEELYTKTRTEAFGFETKLAAVMGCLALSQDHYAALYDKALRARRLIRDSLRFDLYDVLVLPVESRLPVLAGLPSLTFRGMQLAAGVKNEGALLAAWEALS